MLFNNSPVKNVSEKLKSPQTSIKNIKFERKKDFKSFLSYIEREAKALDAIQLPRRNEIQKKKRSGLGAVLGFGALGLLGLFGGAGSDSKRNDYKYINEGGGSGIDLGPVGRRKKGESDSDSSDIKKDSPITPTDIKNFAKNNLDVMSDVTRAASYAVNEKYNEQIKLKKKKEINQEAKNETKQKRKITKRNFRRTQFAKTAAEVGRQESFSATSGMDKAAPDFASRNRLGLSDDMKNIKVNPDDYKRITKKFSSGGFSGGEITDITFRSLSEIGDAKIGNNGIKLFKDSKGNFKIFKLLSVTDQMEYFIYQEALDEAREKILNTKFYKGTTQEEANKILKKKKGSGLFSRLPFSSTLSKSLSKPAFGTEPIKLLKAIRKSGLIKGIKTYAPGKLKTVLFGVDLALTGSAEMDSISKISLRNNIVTALFDLLGPSSTVNRMAEIFNQPGLLIPKVYQGQEGTYIYRDNKIINENIRKIKESNKKDFTRSDIYKGVTGDAEILNRIMHGKKQTPKIETIPKIRSIDKYDFSDDDSGVNIFSDLQELKGRK